MPPACSGCTGSTSAHCVSEVKTPREMTSVSAPAFHPGSVMTAQCLSELVMMSAIATSAATAPIPQLHSLRHYAPIDVYGDSCDVISFWTGESCTVFIGKCHGICSGCHGARDTQCDYCVEHASWDLYGRCACDNHWSGDDCSSYIGSCDERCFGCNGPSNEDCDVCVETRPGRP